MIATQNISLSYSGKPLFKNVNIKFTAGNCYGIIGANGTGKSTFLKVLSGELEPTTGEVVITPGERMAVLRQNHFEFDSYEVLQTVIMGHKRLYEIMKEKDQLYAKEDFTDADGERASELEGEFAELDGWNAESNAEMILTGLGISLDLEHKLMSELDGSQKVKVLLAQALFGNPDILLLDEPTNYLDIQSVRWLENFLLDFPNTVIVVSHDRHFLNKVCTHICDIDFGKIQMYVGNYDFWYEYTQMAARQQKDINKKNEQKIKELQAFIQRFSANASKHKQATSRKKLLDNLQMENFTPSSRRYPHIAWKPDRDIGNDLLTDALDGIIARKFNQITALGKLLDPLADKLSLVTLLGLFVSDGQIPLWVLAIILLKEAAMVIGGGVALKRGIVVYALPIGKVTTVVFVLSIVARFLSWTQIADTLLWISVALSMVALIWYAVDLMKKLGIKADSTK